jgi:thioredoxin 1
MSEQLRDVSDTSFDADVLQSDQPVLVDFWAEWCGPCRMMTPVVEKVADKFQGVAKVYKLNVDDNPSVSQRFGIRHPYDDRFQGWQGGRTDRRRHQRKGNPKA